MADSKDKVEEVDTSSNRASPPTSPDPPASPSKTAPSTTVASPPVPVSPLKPEPPPPGSQPVPDHPVPPSSTTTNSPAPRRPRPPTKGILKPPPPPAKPTLGNRLRDIVTVVGGGAKSLFELPPGSDTPGAGPSTPQPPSQQSVGGTLNALGGRIGLGFSRLVAGSPGNSTTSTPNDSPVPSRSIGLPENGVTPLVSEKKRQKQPLKRATFLLPSLSITYPISSQGEPWSQKVLEERQKIESTHRSLLSTTTGAEYWTSQRLVVLYESACKSRDERPRVGIVRALEVLPNPPRPRHIHITLRSSDHNSSLSSPHTIDTPLNRHSAESLADVLTAEWSLLELKLENGVLDGDDALKAILHALLISGTLPVLSLAGNKKIKAPGWRLLAVFLKRARSLRFVDLSDTIWDRKGIDHLVQGLNCVRVRPPPSATSSDAHPNSANDIPSTPDPKHSSDRPQEKDTAEEDGEADERDSYGSFIPAAPLLKEVVNVASVPAAVQTLRMDGCGLRAAVLEALAQGIRTSDVKNVSLRRNRIGPLGAVALALMMRDYPDSALTMSSLSPSLNSTPPSMHNSPYILNHDQSPPSSVPYTQRRRATAKSETEEAPLPPIPLVISSPASGITSRTVPEGYKPPPPPKHPLVMPSGGNSAMQEGSMASFVINPASAEGKLSSAELGGASVALQRSVRALDGVERIGRLLTLDLKGNEIRTGVGYIAQVLKRNRTLKVLNLSDNRIDAAGLATLAEALKYNSTLETLDLSQNPCCAPSQEGLAALRTAFTVNTSLKRLFLSETGMTNDGAIALAEFLPETKSLLHLDITSNPQIDTAGILAISVGLRANTLIRCLDVSILPNNPDLADLSQHILQACIRNTEIAAAALKSGEGRVDTIWGPIKKSTLVKQVKAADQARAEKERVDQATSIQGVARELAYTLKPGQVGMVAQTTSENLGRWFEAKQVADRNDHHAWEPGQLPKEDFAPLLERAKALHDRLADVIQDTTDDTKLERLLAINDALATQIEKSAGFTPPPRLLLPSQIVPASTPPPLNLAPGGTRAISRRHMRVSSLEISSPNFSIGDSDNDSDAEELDVGSFGTKSSSTGATAKEMESRSGLELGEDSPPPRTPDIDMVGMGVDVPTMAGEDVASPVDKVSRAWVEEEGEIFRKGTRLGVAMGAVDEDEEDENEERSGEQLKQEILETEVARSPTRRVLSVEETESGEEGEGEGESELREGDGDRECNDVHEV